MRLTINGQAVPGVLDEHVLARTIGEMPPHKKVRIVMQGNGRTLLALGRRDKGFRLAWHDDFGHSGFSAQTNLAEGEVVLVLALFASGEPEWDTAVAWLPPGEYHQQWKIPVGPAAFLLFSVPYALIMGWTLYQNEPGAPAPGQVLGGLVAIAGVAAFIQYADFFFRRIRPWLAHWLGAYLGLEVRESSGSSRHGPRAGSWEAEGGTLTNRLFLHLLDVLILIMGLVLPLALVAFSAFLWFNRQW